MTTAKFVRRVVILLIVSILIGIIVWGVSNTANTLISNYLAVGQLENDDASFMFMELYSNVIKPVGKILLILVYSCIGLIGATTTYKFIKNNR